MSRPLTPGLIGPVSHAAALLLGAGWFAAETPLLAQGLPAQRATYSREETRDLLNDYSDALKDRNRYGNNRRPVAPANPNASLTAEMRQIRPMIRTFSESASQLTYLMNDQIGRYPALRTLYADALTVSAEAIGLDRHAAQHNDHTMILDDFEQLNADWRDLAYKLQNVRGLPAETRDLIANLNSLDQQIRKALNTRPQIARQELSIEAASLSGDLQNLLEDISTELGRSPQSQQLMVQTGKARQQMLTLANLCRDSQIDASELAREYKQFVAVWQPLAAKIQSENNGYLQRDIRRINTSVATIHQLLLLPKTIDRSQLVFLAATLKRDIDDFFSRTPLILVMHLPKSGRALATADQFYGVCDHFVDEVNRGEQDDVLVDSFRYIEEAERSFYDVYSDINSDKAVVSLQRVSQTVATIRSALHLQREDFDRVAASDLAASIANLTEQLDTATKLWLSKDQQPFSNAARQETAALATKAAAIHTDLIRGVPVAQLQRNIDVTYEHWRSAYRYLIQCQTEDRPGLGRLSGRLTPALVELRTMISQSTVEQTASRPRR